LLTSTALKAALAAWRRVYQKLIKKKDDKPIPSQPRYNDTRSSERINIFIKKENNNR